MVVAFASDEAVIAVIAPQRVVVGAAQQRVVAFAARQGVTACLTGEGVVQRRAGDTVRVGRAGEGTREHGSDVPYRAVVEGDLLDRVDRTVGVGVVRIAVPEEVVDGDAVGGARDGQHEVFAGALERDLAWRDAGLERQRVQLGDIRVAIVGDPVLAIALAEAVDVVAEATQQPVVAGAAIEGVGTVFADQAVVAAATDQGVVACVAIDGVIAKAG